MKRLAFCSDGTWNRWDRTKKGGARQTNVARMYQAVKPKAKDGTLQVPQYDAGIGTSGGIVRRLMGGAFGYGIGQNVQDAYRFMAERYEKGDELYFFGFSRGAFTVRSAVGMIRKCGLLRKDQLHLVREAYDFYCNPVKPWEPEAVRFRKDHSVADETPVHFLGVWDTVGELGIPTGPLRAFTRPKHKFYDHELSRIVRTARHAVAIDERRKNFAPTLWSTKKEKVKGQSVQQRWFAGVHMGVGGGYRQAGLSNVAFRWMADEAQKAGLDLDPTYLAAHQPDELGRFYESLTLAWKPLGSRWRDMGKDTHLPQDLHESVEIRHAKHQPPTYKPPYKPTNLVAYLKDRKR